jgi:hypothetical protein
MPDLPILTVSDEQMTLLVSSFPGTTLEEKAGAYLAWLTNELIAYVFKVQSAAIRNQVKELQDQLEAQLAAQLPPPVVWPPA